jgi:hypothetical protein
VLGISPRGSDVLGLSTRNSTQRCEMHSCCRQAQGTCTVFTCLCCQPQLLLPPSTLPSYPGVSAYEAKRSKGGKQSPAPGAKGPTPPADAAAAADTAAAKGGKRAAAGAGKHPRSKKQRAMCIVIPLVILAILGGIGAAIGITMGQQRSAVASRSRAAAAAAAAAGAPAAPVTPQPLSFKVNVTLPPDPSGAPAPSCSELFSPKADRGKLEVGLGWQQDTQCMWQGLGVCTSIDCHKH